MITPILNANYQIARANAMISNIWQMVRRMVSVGFCRCSSVFLGFVPKRFGSFAGLYFHFVCRPDFQIRVSGHSLADYLRRMYNALLNDNWQHYIVSY